MPHDIPVLMCQWFAPTTLVVTFETEGPGAFTKEELKGLVVRNKAGKVVNVNLPKKSVLIANHQVCTSASKDLRQRVYQMYFIIRSTRTGGMRGA